jgi:hypothetical protein
MPTIFTVCTTAQLPYARALQASLPDVFEFRIGLIDGQNADNNTVDVAELKLEQWPEMCSRYDEAALLAAAKPFFAAYFLKETNAKQIIYFDPTVQVFGDLQTILDTLKTADIVLTPRLTRPFGESDYADEKFYLNTGLVDAGFWALNRTENTNKFLNWWQERLTTSAHLDLCHAQNHDQLWLMYVPVFFDKVQIVKNVGWNVALHNLNERTLTKQNGKWTVNQGERLLFFNFRELVSSRVKFDNFLQSLFDFQYVKVVKFISKSGAMPLLNNYQKQVGSQPGIYSIHQNLRPTILKWKSWLQNQLSAIIQRIESYPLYH